MLQSEPEIAVNEHIICGELDGKVHKQYKENTDGK